MSSNKKPVEHETTAVVEPKRERRTMVYCRNNVYLEGAGGKAVKVKKGFKVLMSDDETDHFEGAVTRDIPKRSKGEDPIVEFTRG